MATPVINEELARLAKNSYSQYDYKDGEATSNYNSLCASFDGEVTAIIKQLKEPMTDEQAEAVSYYSDRYYTKLAMAINRHNSILTQCPSVLISGAGNFPVAKKEKQNRAMEKFYDECGELFNPSECYYFKRIRAILTNSTIYSDDELAIAKLQKKLDAEVAAHEQMIKQNAYWRKHKTMVGYEGLNDETAKVFDEAINKNPEFARMPAPAFKLSNSSARIRQIKGRIAELERLKANATAVPESKYPAVDGVTVTENSKLMRIQLRFEDAPAEQTRSMLKANGFRWSPREKAWQRQLTDNGIYAAKRVLKALSQTNKEEYT